MSVLQGHCIGYLGLCTRYPYYLVQYVLIIPFYMVQEYHVQSKPTWTMSVLQGHGTGYLGHCTGYLYYMVLYPLIIPLYMVQ